MLEFLTQKKKKEKMSEKTFVLLQDNREIR